MFTRRSRLYSISILFLCLIGIFTIYVASQYWAAKDYNDSFYFMKRQLCFFIPGILLMNISSRCSLLHLRKHTKGIYIASIIALILVLIPGIGIQRNGSRSWFGIGSFLIQPAEFFKIAMIIFLADYLAKKPKLKRFWKDIVPAAMIFAIGFALMMLQPDFGSAMVMACAAIVMLICADVPFHFFYKMGLVAMIGLIALIMSAPYRLARIMAFVDPFQDPLGSGFQMIQSLFAISPSGILGQGIQGGMQKHFYLPEPHTDFIFAMFCESFGFIGALFLLLLYVFIFYQGMKMIKTCYDPFLCYCGVGILSLFAIQTMINLGVVVGLFPVTGVTLPFFSYGGSSLLLMMFSMGLLNALHQEDRL